MCIRDSSDGAINVSDARVTTAAGRPARIDLRVELDGADQLIHTMDQIRSMADVIGIARVATGCFGLWLTESNEQEYISQPG